MSDTTAELEASIKRSLATITTHWDALLAVATPSGVSMGQRTGGKSSRGIPKHDPENDPLGVMVADDHLDTDADMDRLTRITSLRRLATDVLNGWSRLVMEDRPVSKALPDGSNVPSMAAFLQVHAQWMSGHEAADDCRDELETLAAKVKTVTAPTRKEWISLGACPIECEFDPAVGVEVCAGQVRAWPQLQGLSHDEAAHVRLPTCQRCGTEATVEWWQTHMFGNPAASPLVTATDLIAVIAFSLRWVVTHDQIRQWKSRGKIESAGRDARGRTLYRHAGVIEAIRSDVAKQRQRKGA